jgi:hypothetical protein
VELCDSHVLPEFGYAALYDGKHRYFRLIADPKEGERGVKLEQKGLREQLLCKACETKLSRLETYASRLLADGLTVPVPGQMTTNPADYSLLKLFQLSLLWRAHVSSHRMFAPVQLGPHAERLRKMLLDEDPGRACDYPCMMGAVYDRARRMPGLIAPAMMVKRDGHHLYAINFAGFYWSFVVSGQMAKHSWRNYCVQEDGTLPLYASDITKLDGFRRFASDLILNNRAKLARVAGID